MRKSKGYFFTKKKCKDCGKRFKPQLINKNNANRYNKTYCMDCYKKKIYFIHHNYKPNLKYLSLLRNDRERNKLNKIIDKLKIKNGIK